MKGFVLIVFVLLFKSYRAQTIPTLDSHVINVDSIGKKSASDNIYNKTVYGDSLASSFCIVVKKEVKAHKHLTHSEHVIVMEGEGMMRMNSQTFLIKKGDVIFIPKNTIHSVKVTGKVPLKVLSIQAPNFDGKDRIMVDEK